MLRHVALVALVCCLALTAGCGGLRGDEQTAARHLATKFAGKNPSAARMKVASCFGTHLVREAGLDQLKKDKVLDARLRPASMVPDRLSEKTAEAYGDSLVTCFDFAKLKGDIRRESGATAAEVNAYVGCLGRIDKGDLKQSIVDQYTKRSMTSLRKRVDAETKTCGKSLDG